MTNYEQFIHMISSTLSTKLSRYLKSVLENDA